MPVTSVTRRGARPHRLRRWPARLLVGPALVGATASTSPGRRRRQRSARRSARSLADPVGLALALGCYAAAFGLRAVGLAPRAARASRRPVLGRAAREPARQPRAAVAARRGPAGHQRAAPHRAAGPAGRRLGGDAARRRPARCRCCSRWSPRPALVAATWSAGGGCWPRSRCSPRLAVAGSWLVRPAAPGGADAAAPPPARGASARGRGVGAGGGGGLADRPRGRHRARRWPRRSRSPR